MPGKNAPQTEPVLSLEQLVSALARKSVPLPFEIGTFLVLEVCEQLISAPVKLSAAEVWLSEQAEVAISPGLLRRTDHDAARALVMLLGELLVRSAPGVPEMLLELVERGTKDKDLTLGSLHNALEAALVPLNRAATRRVLSRLLREARRDRERGAAVPAPDADALDSEVDSMLGAPQASTPRAAAASSSVSQPPARRPSSMPAPRRVDVPGDDASEQPPARDEHEAIDDLRSTARGRKRRDERPGAHRQPSAAADDAEADEEEADEPVAQAPAPRKVARPARPVQLDEDEGDAAPRLSAKDRKLDAFADGDEHEGERESSGTGVRVGVWLIGLSVLLVGAYLVLGREASRDLVGLGDGVPVPPPAAGPGSQQVQTAVAPRVGELRVSSSPARAQVLLFVGRAPTVVRGLSSGVAHELVAIDDSRLPARAVVPADATWTDENGELKYELALQLGADAKAEAAQELGPTRLPQALGTPSGKTGSVRVITSPPGARVYQLVGFTPDVRVENLPVEEPLELLVYLSGYALSRTTLTAQSYKADSARWVADLDVTLTPR